jgi:colanic acid/amylovoran biosynthesis glycosyltransferase
MADPHLFLFTFKYPYEPPTEQFLNDEIPFLEAKSDFHVVPCSQKLDSTKKSSFFIEKSRSVVLIKRNRLKDLVYSFLSVLCLAGYLRPEIIKIRRTIPKHDRHVARRSLMRYFLQACLFYGYFKRAIPGEIRDCNHIIFYSYWFDPVSVALAFYKKRLLKMGCVDIKVFSRAHGQGDLYFGGKFGSYRPFSNLLSSELDKVFAISEDGQKYLFSQGIRNVSVSRLGVSFGTPLFKNPQRRHFIIVSCSVINSNKRVGFIAQAISCLGGLSVDWYHFGDGLSMDELEKWCSSNMPNGITFHIKGRTDNATIKAFYRDNQPDLFINLSLVEGIPVSIMEAMSFSIPCVATDVGATREIVHQNENGFLVSPCADKETVAKVIRLYCALSIKEKETFRESAFRTWETEYNSDANFSRFADSIFR